LTAHQVYEGATETGGTFSSDWVGACSRPSSLAVQPSC